MKTRKLSGILTLAVSVAIIFALVFTACPHDVDDNNGGGNNNNQGSGTNTGGKDGSTITAPVIGVPAGVTDFSYAKESSSKYVPISNYIPNSSVTVIGGNVTLKLGVPLSQYLGAMLGSGFPSGITVNPDGTKIFDESFDTFYTSDGKYMLTLNVDKNATDSVRLVYAEKDVTATGQYTDSGYLNKFNVSMKAGWNYAIVQQSGTTRTATSSTTLPSGYSWQVIQNPYWHDELYNTLWTSYNNSNILFGVPTNHAFSYYSSSAGQTYGTYTLSGSTVTLTFNQGQSMTGTYTGTLSGNTLTINSLGTFTKYN
jgi:hypothetical protein